MNGAQDMGGLQGFGPVRPDGGPNGGDPHFHEAWEKRVFALTLAMGATGSWNLDEARHARESLPPADYLSFGYYRIWLEALIRLMRQRALIGDAELATGQARGPVQPLARRLQAQDVPSVLARGGPTERAAPGPARFSIGQAVVARRLNPEGHTRLPRYVRGCRGTVIALHGAHIFPDAHASGQGEQACWLYTVQFDARELWGKDTSASSVCVDCWEPYLLPADTSTASA